jgi:hypothetical protein
MVGMDLKLVLWTPIDFVAWNGVREACVQQGAFVQSKQRAAKSEWHRYQSKIPSFERSKNSMSDFGSIGSLKASLYCPSKSLLLTYEM